jgi:hypothetical protein
MVYGSGEKESSKKIRNAFISLFFSAVIFRFVSQSLRAAAVQRLLRPDLSPALPARLPGPRLPGLQGAARRAARAPPPLPLPLQHGGRDHRPAGAGHAGGVQPAAQPLLLPRPGGEGGGRRSCWSSATGGHLQDS